MKPLYTIGKYDLYHFHEYMSNFESYGMYSDYFDWWNDCDVTRHNSHGLFPLNMDEFEQIKRDGETGKIIHFAIVSHFSLSYEITKPTKYRKRIHIGNISLRRIDWINKSAEFAVVIGEKDYWGKGICTSVAGALFEHGFNKLNLHRLWSGTASTNIGMQRVFKKLGMKHEGTFMDAMYLNGQYVDVVEYGILKSEWMQKK